jgi:UDP-N-acetylglucosamine diphosphorylase/glucosamine-1-phosphate N-acetyltransferase
MSMIYCLFEDQVSDFFPLVHLRPVFDLACGALTIRQKWERRLGARAVRTMVRVELPEFRERPDHLAAGDADGGVWMINGRVIPDRALAAILRKAPRGPKVVVSGDVVVAAYFPGRSTPSPFDVAKGGVPDFTRFPAADRQEVEAGVISNFWDLVRLNPAEIASDRALLGTSLRRVNPKSFRGAHFIVGAGIYAGPRTVIKPGVVIDAENGPVIIGSGVTIMPNAVVIGPSVIGNGSTVKAGAKIYGGTAIGAQCKVGGEVEASVMLPYSNKQHEGFLGHSYLASWVNIGADTNTSDLKNTYGPVSIVRGGKKVDTGMQFLGLTMGDHSKSGINVMFDTGTVVGVCSNVFGAGLPPKEIPSFSWGGADGIAPYDPAKGFEVMKIVMARRGVSPGPSYERTVRELFGRTETDRRTAGVR